MVAACESPTLSRQQLRTPKGAQAMQQRASASADFPPLYLTSPIKIARCPPLTQLRRYSNVENHTLNLQAHSICIKSSSASAGFVGILLGTLGACPKCKIRFKYTLFGNFLRAGYQLEPWLEQSGDVIIYLLVNITIFEMKI